MLYTIKNIFPNWLSCYRVKFYLDMKLGFKLKLFLSLSNFLWYTYLIACTFKYIFHFQISSPCLKSAWLSSSLHVHVPPHFPLLFYLYFIQSGQFIVATFYPHLLDMFHHLEYSPLHLDLLNFYYSNTLLKYYYFREICFSTIKYNLSLHSVMALGPLF